MPTNRAECIHHLVEAQAALTPEADAIVFEQEILSYAELNRRANRVAHYLIGRGVGPETLVGLCMHRSPEILIAMLGILKAGGAYVGIDPAYPKSRQAFIIEDAAMPVVVTQQDLVDSLPVTQAGLVRIDSDWPAIEVMPDTNPDVKVHSGNLAYILYTSGSTGRPKGVAIEHSSVVTFLGWAKNVFSPEELAGTLAGTSICFDLSVFEIFVPLSRGGAVILAVNAVALPTLPARDRVTLINTVPSAMSALVNVGGVPESVRVVNLAGEPLPNKLVQDIYATGRVEKVYNLYGPSEDTTYSTFALAEKGVTTKPTIGVPLDGTQAYIVDDKMQLVEPGVTGELCLSGAGLARGYLNRPDLTAAKFLPNPFGEGRLYRTGDLARLLPDGNIDFLGRMDHQVKVRGYRIELGEIETVLEQHPAVDRAVVLAQPDARGELQLAGYVSRDSRGMESPAQGDASTQDVAEHVKLWSSVYEQTYRQNPAPEDLSFNTSGWISSYTGAPIPTPEMREWLDDTVKLILDLKPRNVLELGCGTGMILARVAPHCESYVGLDISPAGLDNIRAMQKVRTGLDRVTLYERAADDLSGLEPIFDTVVINSVVQHFPGASYLALVLERAAKLVAPGGRIFIGDVLSLPLHEAFHTSVQMYRAEDSDTAADVQRRIGKLIAQERDLLFAPEFFTALAERLPAITHVQAMPKHGHFQNQLTRFRFDAILHIGSAVETPREVNWIDWQRENLTLEGLRARLRHLPGTAAIRNIPNARLHDEELALQWLQEAVPGQTVADFRAQLRGLPVRGVAPEDLRGLEAEGYSVELSWLNSNARGTFDAVIAPRNGTGHPARFRPSADTAKRPLQDFANHPYKTRQNRELIPQLRQHLRERLPAYMEPPVFTVLDRFPQTPTGKIDRRALAELPVAQMPSGEKKIAAQPRTPVEGALLQVWTDVLSVGPVGVHDNFFELGGNSLSAMALTHRLQKLLDLPFRPATLLQAPTVSQFAAYIDKTYPNLELARSAAPAMAGVVEGEI